MTRLSKGSTSPSSAASSIPSCCGLFNVSPGRTDCPSWFLSHAGQNRHCRPLPNRKNRPFPANLFQNTIRAIQFETRPILPRITLLSSTLFKMLLTLLLISFTSPGRGVKKRGGKKDHLKTRWVKALSKVERFTYHRAQRKLANNSWIRPTVHGVHHHLVADFLKLISFPDTSIGCY